MIVATAGHVDHGKTSLIHALTGVDTDRLPEEKERGLTVDLGFAYLPLASGDVIGFVDVPGHERFVRNMVAGIAGIDLALVVIAADDGVMPQTIEHVAVLDLLGVDRALIALTKVDRASPERVEVVADEALMLLEKAGLVCDGLFETVAPTMQGIPALYDALTEAARNLEPPGTQGGFRLAVDRAFVVRGAGVVVTGMVHAGTVSVGDQLTIMPDDRPVRVRAIHAQDQASDTARRGDRAALNLVGVERDDVGRGDWVVATNILGPSRRIDVSLQVLGSEARPLKHWTPVHVHHGAGHATGRVAVLQGGTIAPGDHGLSQIVLDDPLVPAFGDRLVLRDQSARRTLAGGRVIDPRGPERGRARPERLKKLEAMDRDDAMAALDALLACSPEGVAPAVYLQGRNQALEATDALAEAMDCVALGRGQAMRLIRRSHWDTLRQEVLAGLATDHAEHGDRLGPNLAELRRYLSGRPSDRLLGEALTSLAHDDALVQRGAIAHLPDHSVALEGKDEKLWKQAQAALTPETGSPPALFPLAEMLGQTPGDLEKFLQRMAGFGLIVKIARNRYLTTDQIEQATHHAQEAGRQQPEGFTVAQYRDVAGIGRNLAVDLVEFLDRIGVTTRRGDLRVLVQAGDGVSS
jgi:selenocysteine-specific elongation factor